MLHLGKEEMRVLFHMYYSMSTRCIRIRYSFLGDRPVGLAWFVAGMREHCTLACFT